MNEIYKVEQYRHIIKSNSKIISFFLFQTIIEFLDR